MVTFFVQGFALVHAALFSTENLCNQLAVEFSHIVAMRAAVNAEG